MTGPQASTAVLLRIEKGLPDAGELAALAAILGSGRAVAPPAQGRRLRAGWRRPEQAARFDGPRSWQAVAAEPGGQLPEAFTSALFLPLRATQ